MSGQSKVSGQPHVMSEQSKVWADWDDARTVQGLGPRVMSEPRLSDEIPILCNITKQVLKKNRIPHRQ